MIQIQENFLPKDHLQKIKDWIVTNEYLDDFDEAKRAFSVTYRDFDLPQLLQPWLSPGYNTYHFIGIITDKSGSIDEHVDEELVKMFNEQYGRPIRYPQTRVLYVDIDESMIGGELVSHNTTIKPVTNMLATMDPKTIHSVNVVESTETPRIVLVCELYKLLNINYVTLDTPIYSYG